jgi:cytidylate kinase
MPDSKKLQEVFKMIITLGGMPGSGKSTVGKYLSERFKLKKYSMGDLRRRMAVDRGMTLEELNKLGEKEAWTDKDADDYQKNVLAKEDGFVIDGRLSWFFIPDSIKIYLKVDAKKGAERIFKEQRGESRGEKKWNSAEEVQKFNEERVKSDAKRYKQLYDIDPTVLENYDIIIDTSEMNIMEMNLAVEKAVLKFLEEKEKV